MIKNFEQFVNESINKTIWFFTEEWNEGGVKDTIVNAYGCISKDEEEDILDQMDRWSPYDYAMGQECETEEEYIMKLESCEKRGYKINYCK